MKKPKITEGEWSVDSNGYMVIDEDGDIIAEIESKNSDAQSISAVPDLIEALIQLLDTSKKEVPPKYRQDYAEVWENAEQALKKAGVEL